VDCGLKVDVLMHEREAFRPTSTGHLIRRVIEGAQTHVWEAGKPFAAGGLRAPEHELWILHPNGEELPAGPAPESLQVVLVDGSWKQATAMMKTLSGWGRRVRLPITGQSRYWLRNQLGPEQFSTAEALLFLLKALGREEAHERFRLQFELHVYAMLCARGEKTEAAEYLQQSPVAAAMPALVAKLNHCRKDHYY